MKIQQTVTQEGHHLVLTLTEYPSGKVLARRVWEDASKYVCQSHAEDHIQLLIPKQTGLDIKEDE